MSEEESSVEVRGAMETKERVAVVLHESKLEKIFRAICVNGAILAVGLSLGLVGTALPDLQSRTNGSFEALTKIFVGRGLGFLVGSIASNYLLSLANQACWITSALVVLAVTTATIPNCTSLALLMGTLFLQGVACGVVKAGCGFICRNHFSRVEVAWAKTLFISFAVGAFLAPLLLLPFTSVSTLSTNSKTGSLRYNEDLPVHTSTISLRVAPVRNHPIAPNILARFHRKRRSADDDAIGFPLNNETVAMIGSVETSTDFSPGGFGGGNSTKETLDEIAVEVPIGESGKQPDGFTPSTNGSVLEVVRIFDRKDSSSTPSLSTPSSSTPSSSTLSSSTSSTSSSSTSSTPSSSTSSSSTPPVQSNGSTTPVAGAANVSVSPPSQISSTMVGSSTTKAVPKKPLFVDGDMLSAESKVADSSKFRHEIRDNLKKDIPDVVEPKTTVHTPKAMNSSTPTSSPLPTVTAVPLLVDEDLDRSMGEVGNPIEAGALPLATNMTSLSETPPGPGLAVQSSPSLSYQSPLATPTSASTQSTVPSSTSFSTQTAVPASTLSPVPSASSSSNLSSSTLSSSSTQSSSTPSSSTPSSSTPSSTTPSSSTPTSIPTSRKSTHSPTLASSKPLPSEVTAIPTTLRPIPFTRPSDAVTEGEGPAEMHNLGHLWLTKYSYWLAALVVGLSAMSFAFYWVLCPRVYQTGMSSSSEDLATSDSPKIATSCRAPAFLVVTSFHLIYAGLEVTLCMLVTSYAVLRLGWSGRLGVLLGATYWGSFMTCRVATFALFRYIRQSLVLLGGLLLCIAVAAGAFVSFQQELCESNAFVWATVGALGFGMGAVLPGSASEIDKVFPRQAELFQTLGSSIGEMVLPPVLGMVMAIEDPAWLAYTTLAAFVLCTVVAIAIRVLVVRAGEGRAPRGARSLPSLDNDDLEDVLTNTNDETELLAKGSHSQTGSPLNGSGGGTQAVTQMAIQSLMKNISNTKKD